MEIIIIAVVAIAILVFIVGGIDNNRPVAEWSDEKLARMHGKLIRLASIKMQAGDYRCNKNDLLLEEVKKEIIKRQVAHEIGAALAAKVNEENQHGTQGQV